MARKTKILLFIDWYLPGYRAGGPTRSCANLIEHLNGDFDFSVVTRDTDYMKNEPYPGIKHNAWNVLQNGTRVYYFSSSNLSREAIYTLLQDEEYQYIYLNGIFSKYFTLIPLQYLRNKRNKKVIVASRGMLTESALNIKKWKKSCFLFFVKQFDLFDNVIFHATNEQESLSIKKVFGGNAHVHIAPNLPEKITFGEWKRKIRSGNVLKLVCVARIAPEKNIRFSLDVLRDVKANVQFDLFGPVYNQNYWKECNAIIKELPENIKTRFMDSIESQKVPETLARYDFLFLPTLGENFGHVILQAMRVGVPVIISDRTMWRQLEAKLAGWDIPLTDKNKFVSLLEECSVLSQQGYDVLSRGAFDFALSYINGKESLWQNKQLFLK